MLHAPKKKKIFSLTFSLFPFEQDYMERQAIEMEREMLREERAAAAGLLSPNSANLGSQNLHNDHAPVSTSLSVPGAEPSNSQLAIRRSSSFKFSRRRARSCGPSHRPKGTYKRSGSIDHRPGSDDMPQLANLAHSKEGSSAPVITGDASILRGTTKASSLKMNNSHPAAGRKLSVDFDLANHSAVPDSPKKNTLTVPAVEPKKQFLEVPDVDHQNKNFLTVPNHETGSNPHICVPQEEIFIPSEESLSLSSGSKTVTRPGNLTLKECYLSIKEDNHKCTPHILPVRPFVLGSNGPLTNVEVHYVDSSNPSSSTDLLRPPCHSSMKLDSLDLPLTSSDQNKSQSSELFFLGTNDKLIDDSSLENVLEVKSKHQRNKSRQKLSLFDSPPSYESLLKLPSPNSNHTVIYNGHDERALAMQMDKSLVLCNSSENRILLGAECPPVNCDSVSKDGISDHYDHFDGLMLASEGYDECDDHVDSMTELISDTFRHEILTNAKPTVSTPVGIGATQKISRQNSAATPDDDIHLSSRKGSSGAASKSSKSGSGRWQGSGKAKSPTTPMWMNLKTPLARIESFHSDDFDNLRDSDNDEKGSASSMSVTTPTVPCFAYKLHLMKKKQTKLKNKNSSSDSGCGSLQNNDYSSSKVNRTSDRKLRQEGR